MIGSIFFLNTFVLWKQIQSFWKNLHKFVKVIDIYAQKVNCFVFVQKNISKLSNFTSFNSTLCCSWLSQSGCTGIVHLDLVFQVSLMFHSDSPLKESYIRHKDFRWSSFFVRLRVPPLDSETGWTGEHWSNPILLIFEN